MAVKHRLLRKFFSGIIEILTVINFSAAGFILPVVLDREKVIYTQGECDNRVTRFS